MVLLPPAFLIGCSCMRKYSVNKFVSIMWLYTIFWGVVLQCSRKTVSIGELGQKIKVKAIRSPNKYFIYSQVKRTLHYILILISKVFTLTFTTCFIIYPSFYPFFDAFQDKLMFLIHYLRAEFFTLQIQSVKISIFSALSKLLWSCKN